VVPGLPAELRGHIAGGKKMVRSISINIGINQVDPSHYRGFRDLYTSENTARAMFDIADSLHYDEKRLIQGPQATSAAIIDAIKRAKTELEPNGILLLTYSGHGSHIADNGFDEPDSYHETWVLYDRQLLDCELHMLLREFDSRTRVFVLSDSCYSGTVISGIDRNERVRINLLESLFIRFGSFRIDRERYMLRETLLNREPPIEKIPPYPSILSTYYENRDIYDEIQAQCHSAGGTSIQASAILISACQDNQRAIEGTTHGRFTEILLEVWANGSFPAEKGYREFHSEIAQKSPLTQTPNILPLGPPNPGFMNQRPFTIAPPA